MAKDKSSIIVYADWISVFDGLEDEEAGRLIKHFFRYVNDKNPEAPDRITKLLFEPIKQTLKRDLRKYKDKCLKNRDNVNVRWNKENTNVNERIRPDTKHTDSDSDSDSDNEIDKKNIIPPTIEMVIDYCQSRNSTVDPQAFIDWNTSKGWIIGKNKMKDWQASVRTWEARDKEKNKVKKPDWIMP